MRFTFTFISKSKLKFSRLFSRLRGKGKKTYHISEFAVVETFLPNIRDLSVIMEADELDEMGIDWDVDAFGTLFWDLNGEWVEGWFEREYGFTAM
jgi:hypothetical protein